MILFKRYLSLFFLILMICNGAFCQNKSLGSWNVHLPYKEGKKVAATQKLIYCGTEFGLFTFDQTTLSVKRVSKIDGLSDINVEEMNYVPELDILVIAYDNTNLDFIKGNNIINMNDIKRKSISDKKINKLYYSNNNLYIACNFGIVVVDLINFEIIDTYKNLGVNGSQVNVKSIGIIRDSLMIATDKGIYMASVNHPNLLDYASWTNKTVKLLPWDASFNNLVVFGDRAFVSNDSSVYIYDNGNWTDSDIIGKSENIRDLGDELAFVLDMSKQGQPKRVAFMDKSNNIRYLSDYFLTFVSDVYKENSNSYWFADYGFGLVHYVVSDNAYYSIYPDGPSITVYDKVYSSGEEIYATSKQFSKVTRFKDNEWELFQFKKENDVWENYGNTWIAPGPQLFTQGYSILKDEKNQTLYIGAWGDGVLEWKSDGQIEVYDESNSLIQSTVETTYPVITDMKLDSKNNLWMLNLRANTPILVKTTDGTWHSYATGVSYFRELTAMVIDDNDHIWATIGTENSAPGGILVFNHNGTLDDPSDDEWKHLNNTAGNGDLPDRVVHAIAKDLEGEIWVGTDDGIVVFYNPQYVFAEGADFDARCPVLQQRCLLTDQEVTAIAVDAANRKWVGTRTGVWLFNEDGTGSVSNFTTQNSPLLSDQIISITINHLSGDVYIDTDKGIISYKGSATTPFEVQENVMVYPNPVPPEFEGVIAIRGLAKNANVKITDVTGKLVFETKSLGGSAIWDGRDLNQRKVNTGIYLVFSASEAGDDLFVTKVAFIN